MCSTSNISLCMAKCGIEIQAEFNTIYWKSGASLVMVTYDGHSCWSLMMVTYGGHS